MKISTQEGPLIRLDFSAANLLFRRRLPLRFHETLSLLDCYSSARQTRREGSYAVKRRAGRSMGRLDVSLFVSGRWRQGIMTVEKGHVVLTCKGGL